MNRLIALLLLSAVGGCQPMAPQTVISLTGPVVFVAQTARDAEFKPGPEESAIRAVGAGCESGGAPIIIPNLGTLHFGALDQADPPAACGTFAAMMTENCVRLIEIDGVSPPLGFADRTGFGIKVRPGAHEARFEIERSCWFCDDLERTLALTTEGGKYYDVHADFVAKEYWLWITEYEYTNNVFSPERAIRVIAGEPPPED
ncbi:MAG: hypothetical protein R3D05_15575 [Dongiaceae bacterium]